MDKHQILKECVENVMLLTQLGLSVAVPPLLCLYAANWLRGVLGLGLWIMVIALLLGLGSAGVNVWRFWKLLQKRWDKQDTSGRVPNETNGQSKSSDDSDAPKFRR